ncbi:MAG: preprotein translocase subunit YajC [Bacteroidales bacterium]|jgi:preprotein translocase subunit YajC|nr:preprotein translocase subunit YajC [Bacteroidales bacterium]
MLNYILLDISNGWKTAIMIILMIAVFYLFLIRPQSQQAKKEAAYRNGLKKGDRVMTNTGIHATVVSNNGTQAQIQIAENAIIKVATSTLTPIPEPKR